MSLFFPEKQPLREDLIGLQLLNAYSFWSRKRVVFNICVIIAIVVGTVTARPPGFYLDDLIGPVCFLLALNVFYGCGYGLDSFIIVKSNGKKSLGIFRMALFATGLFLSALVGGILTFQHFI